MRNLTTSKILRYAERYHSKTPIVSYFLSGEQGVYTHLDVQRYTYADMGKRCAQFTNQLLFFNKTSIVVGVLSCNTYRHLEIAYAVTGSGKIYMPLNPKLEVDCLRYIIGHSKMAYCYYEKDFTPIIDQIRYLDGMTASWICIEDNYQTLLDYFDDEVQWPSFCETTPAMLCYTSGTTSKPKGVIYTHRDLLLSSMMGISPDAFGLSAIDCILPIPGMHASGSWGLLWMAPMVGAKLVLINDCAISRSFLDRYTDILDLERVTVSAGIPSFWTYFLEYLIQNNYTSRFQHLYLDKIIVGGCAIHPLLSIRFKQFDIQIVSTYGMTENLFTGFYSSLNHSGDTTDYDIFLDRIRPVFGIDIKIDEEDQQWTDRNQGHIMIRGLWCLQSYYKGASDTTKGTSVLMDGWFPTEDFGSINTDGYLTVLERKKDMVRLAGTWTSSVLLENIALNHPNVLQCAVVGICDPLLGELCAIVLKTKEPMLETDVIKLYVNRQLIPGYVLFVDDLPMTAHDKIDKDIVKQLVYDVLHGISFK